MNPFFLGQFWSDQAGTWHRCRSPYLNSIMPLHAFGTEFWKDRTEDRTFLSWNRVKKWLKNYNNFITMHYIIIIRPTIYDIVIHEFQGPSFRYLIIRDRFEIVHWIVGWTGQGFLHITINFNFSNRKTGSRPKKPGSVGHPCHKTTYLPQTQSLTKSSGTHHKNRDSQIPIHI